jgi:hypothetical protein
MSTPLAACGVQGSPTQTGTRSSDQAIAGRSTHLDSGVRGQVVYGPTCPVRRPGHACVRPYQATISILSRPTTRLITRARSSRDGRFSIALAPGRYLLVPRGGRPYPRSSPQAVTVRPHRYTSVIINYESGIRTRQGAQPARNVAGSSAVLVSAGGRRSGIAGQATDPQCSVPIAGQRSCARHPLTATIQVLRLPGRHQVATIHTGRHGRFRIALPAAAYELTGQTRNYSLVARPVTVRVHRDHFQHVMLDFFRRHPLPVGPGAAHCKACPPPPPG